MHTDTVDSNRTLSTLENDVEFAFLGEAVPGVFTCLPKYMYMQWSKYLASEYTVIIEQS